MVKKKFLFISSMNLASNPRILKEIKLALSEGHHVTFAGFKLGDWSDEKDMLIRQGIPDVNCIYFEATRINFWQWFYDSVMERMARIAWPLFRNNLFLTALAHSKRTLSLLRFSGKVHPGEYDIVAGHTLAALYPVYKTAVKAKCIYSFDVEDYHPGERIVIDAKNEIKRRELLLKKLLPGASIIIAASPLIAKAIDGLVSKISTPIYPVLNYFPVAEFIKPLPTTDNRMRMVWFSQHISFGRGLEAILAIWDKLNEHFHLTLIGNLDKVFYDAVIVGKENIEIKTAMSQDDLHKELSNYDIGLAIEMRSADLNRNICITNKLLAYFQAGLYIIATDTDAQKEFMMQYPQHGITVTKHSPEILQVLKNIYTNKEQIRSGSFSRFDNASNESWEKEASQIKILWQTKLTA